MKNWSTLEPDVVCRTPVHFTPGRGGHRIKKVVLHHMAMIGEVEDCVRVWRSRPASATYCVGPHGRIGQAVWDRDTPWSNANLVSNQESITIEHSNCGGREQDWPISPETLEEGAHLVAAICAYYKLGRPVSGKNVSFHDAESGGITSCPYHLRPGHKYHDAYMQRAGYWYDQMTRPQTPKYRQKGAEMVTLIKSLINPRKAFSLEQYAAITDAHVWQLLVLTRAIAVKVGIDPDAEIRQAVDKDREGK